MEPNFSEEQLQVMQYLAELETSDPALFARTMEALQATQSDSGSVSGSEKLSVADSETKADHSPFVIPDLKEKLAQKQKSNQPPSIAITPEPGFVIKTKRSSDNTKIFVNICTHPALEAPSMKKKLDDKGESVEGLNIPLSVGAGRQDKDKSGVACTVYDIVVNPKVLEEANEDKTGSYRDFLCQLSIQSLEQKYQENLDRRYKLPKLKYLGDVIEKQNIRDLSKAPKIVEVADNENKKKESISSVSRKAAPPGVVVAAPVIADVPLPYRVYWIVERSDEILEDLRQHRLRLPLTDSGEVVEDDRDSRYCFVRLTTVLSNDYIEPIQQPHKCSAAVKGIAVRSELQGNVEADSIAFQLSPFKLQLKVRGHLPVVLYLPCSVLPGSATCQLYRPPGAIHRIELCLNLPLDTEAWDKRADAGSKVWLLAQALQNNDESASSEKSNPYVVDESSHDRKLETVISPEEDDLLPEDKFHINLPTNVDKYTGQPIPNRPTESGPDYSGSAKSSTEDNEELPEDRFHRKDASSAYIINQREEAIRKKRENYEKEKEERKNDPNVEYIDLDDFKENGKYGPKRDLPLNSTNTEAPKPAVSQELTEENNTSSCELKRAAEVVAELAPEEISGLKLSSSLWTELV